MIFTETLPFVCIRRSGLQSTGCPFSWSWISRIVDCWSEYWNVWFSSFCGDEHFKGSSVLCGSTCDVVSLFGERVFWSTAVSKHFTGFYLLSRNELIQSFLFKFLRLCSHFCFVHIIYSRTNVLSRTHRFFLSFFYWSSLPCSLSFSPPPFVCCCKKVLLESLLKKYEQKVKLKLEKVILFSYMNIQCLSIIE